MKSEKLKIWVAFAIVSTVWGSTWLAIKIGLQSLPPFFAAGMRFSIAAVLLYILLRVRRQKIPFDPNARRIYVALGVLSFSIPFALVYWGQQFIPSGLSSILFAAYPFWVALFQTRMIAGEPLGRMKVGGIVIGFLGVTVIFAGDIGANNPLALVGMATIIVSTFLQAYVLILIKKYGKPISPVTLNFAGMLIGMLLLLGLSAAVERGMPIQWNAAAILSVLYLAVVGSVVAFVSYYWLLKRIDAVYLSLTSFINPIVAVILGAAFLGESMTPWTLAGSLLVLSGILVANGKALYAKVRPAH